MMHWQLGKKSFLLGLAFLMGIPQMAGAFAEPSVLETYVNRKSLVPIIKAPWGNFILHTDQLNKLYSLRGYRAVWVDSMGSPNQMTQALRDLFRAADRHGLLPAEYWDSEIEKLFQSASANPKNWITFELAASEALLRYAKHLSVGRFDPSQVDTDIKYKWQDFNSYNLIAEAISTGPSSLSFSLDLLAPKHPRYQDLMEILSKLREMKDRGGWLTLSSPGYALKKGISDPIIGRLRSRFNQLGYKIDDNGNNHFDQEFEDVLKRFQALNGLAADGIIGTRSEVLRNLNFSVNQRIAQVELTMEKMRWMPRTLEPRHIFVNLATTEFQLEEESGTALYFRTINGQALRRTPSMRDLITYVNFNPYWTVPRSIAVKDKLPLLKEDRNYLQKHNMLLIDEKTDRVLNPTSINWKSLHPEEFTFYIRQMPGNENALGVVKFPLQNPWSIYMHDTNDRSLFLEGERHRSSGCVRLEKPLELAAYLLKDQAGWALDEIKAYVPSSQNEKAEEIDKKVSLRKAMPVYFMYLTVERSSAGEIRFVEDVYGQDLRLGKALQNFKKSADEVF